MVFGVGEIVWERYSQGKVDGLTWAANAMILILGGLSLLTQEGIWFKLQPALIEIAMAIGLWVSIMMGKPFLIGLLQKQGDFESRMRPELLGPFRVALRGITFRLGLFFALQAAVAVWAALYWSTASWVLLKGVGLTASLVVYGVVESFVLRYKLAYRIK